MPHQELGPYRLEGVLGRGGMGIVYSAFDRRLERQVAMKRMLTGTEDPSHRDRLRREARTTAQLAHPAIIQVFDLIEDEDCDWIVMELAEGTPLEQVLRDGPLSVDSALKYALQIAEGLVAAHELGIVHRDLKTENVMVLPDGRIKILDFGIAKRLDFSVSTSADRTLPSTGEVIGTSRAMAPEQARGVRVSPRSDLFSFGVLIYEMLAGTSPFRGPTPVETLARVLTHHPEPVDELATDVPSALVELVERLLHKPAELRPASAREVVSTLSQIVDTRRDEARDTGSARELDTDSVRSSADPTSAEVDSERSGWDESRILGPLGRAIILAVLLVIIVFISLTIFRRHPVPSPEPDPAPIHALTDDPLGHYEENMRTLRRVDRPENVDRVITLFRKALDRNGTSAAAHAGLARALWEKARNAAASGDSVFLEQALVIAKEGVRLDAYLADARTSLGLILYALGKYDDAAKELALALEIEPTQADARYGLGKLAEARGHREYAEERYRQASELQPEPIFLNALGSLLYDQGRYGEAEKIFSQCLTVAPDNIHALRNLGSLYYAQGRIDDAAAKFQSALKIRPDASLYSNLGTIFFSRGLYSKAATTFEDALRMDGAANRYIFWLNLADAYRQVPGKEEKAQRSYLRAIQMLDGFIQASPGDVRLLSRRALARSRAGDREGAAHDIAWLQAAGTSGDLYSLFRLAVAEEICGDRESALAHLEEAFRAGLAISEARYEPDLQGLRSDVRFHHLLVKLDEPL